MGTATKVFGGILHVFMVVIFFLCGVYCMFDPIGYAKLVDAETSPLVDASVMMKSEFRHVGCFYFLFCVMGVIALLQRCGICCVNYQDAYNDFLKSGILLNGVICLSRLISFFTGNFAQTEIICFAFESGYLAWLSCELSWELKKSREGYEKKQLTQE